MARKKTECFIDKKTSELNQLIVSGTNPDRRKKLQEEIDYFNYGIKPKN